MTPIRFPTARRLSILAVWLYFPVCSWSQGVPDISSVLGPAPGSPAFFENQLRQDRQRETAGFLVTSEEQLRRYEYESLTQPLNELTKRLAFTPVQLDSTPFHEFEIRGGSADHFGDGGASALHRTFRSSSSNMFDLLEWDMSVYSGTVMLDPARQTERVNGLPAQLVILQAPSGRAFSILSWVEGRRSYELTVDANVKSTIVSPGLLELANSIPKSVPSRATETQIEWPGLPPKAPKSFR